jgi:hypothetical protein
VVRHKDSAGVECHTDSVEPHTLNKALARRCRVVLVLDTDSAERYILDSVPVGHSQAVLALHCRVVPVLDLDLDPKP